MVAGGFWPLVATGWGERGVRPNEEIEMNRRKTDRQCCKNANECNALNIKA